MIATQPAIALYGCIATPEVKIPLVPRTLCWAEKLALELHSLSGFRLPLTSEWVLVYPFSLLANLAISADFSVFFSSDAKVCRVRNPCLHSP